MIHFSFKKIRGRRICLHGLTLIELMIALVIFSILGIMSYRAISTAIESRQRLADEFQRWRDIAHFFQMAESDMLQIVARPTAASSSGQPSLLVASGSQAAETEFSFLKLDGANSSVRRRGYLQEGNHVVLLQWPGIDVASSPRKDIVLDNVKALRVSVITASGQRAVSWPPNPATASSLPAAIDIELELADAGTIHRLFALH